MLKSCAPVRMGIFLSRLGSVFSISRQDLGTGFSNASKHSTKGRLVQWLLGLVILIASTNANAKDLSNRLGIGFKNQSSVELPGVAIQYWPGAELGLSAAIGLDTQPNSSKFSAMLKLYRIIFPEDNLNFYMGAGAGILSQESSGSNSSGFELLGFAGVELFLAGLENVGFSFEMGTAITSISSGTRFRTLGDSPVRAGITFYF